jgi:hypothetical protein
VIPRFLLLLACLAGSTIVHAACGRHDDFLARADPLLAPVQPVDCATVTQTPPEFTWPPVDGAERYEVAVKSPDGKIEKRSSTRNFVIWPHALRPGTYTWTVKVMGRKEQASEARAFTIDGAAVEFVVPGGEAALERAKKTPRPRSWPHDGSSPVAAAKTDRAGGLKDLQGQVDGSMAKPLPPEPRGSKDGVYDAAVAATKLATASALACALGHQPTHCMDATRRLVHLASWNPQGPAGYKSNDMASRTIAWTLALGYDWLHDSLNPQQKGAILAAIKAHAQPMFDDIAPRISKNPYDSHGNVTLTIVAAIGALMAGDIPEADEWLKSTISMAIVWTSPWGGADGGFGNGTAQMYWDTQSNLPAWYVWRNAVGADLARKDWVRHFGRAMAYLIPPGTPSGLFGDGQELKLDELWARVAKAYAAFAPSPLARWYATQMKGEDGSRLEILMAPKGEGGDDALPANTPNAAFFPSIGWVAMHSNLADPKRTSVYFKSSPYGSYNHSHGDQNSFVVNDRGKRLLIASGYYDNYRTNHWNNWYKQTRSTNAITFDGGQGQGLNERRFAGAITKFATTPAFDFAVGRADAAYEPSLALAQRSIAYLRPGTIIVHDALASDTARTWEWNFHAVRKMTPVADNRVAVANEDAKACVEMLASPGVAFRQADKFTAPPNDSKMANEWHGTFATTKKSQKAEFVALVRVGSDCSRPSGATAKQVGGGWEVAVDGRTVTFADGNVALR